MSALSLSASEGVDWVSSVALSADLLVQDLFLGQSKEGWVDSSWATTGSCSSEDGWDLSDGHSVEEF